MLRVLKGEQTNTPWFSTGGECIMIGCDKNKKCRCKERSGKKCVLLDAIKNDKYVNYTVFEIEEK